jgi:Fe-S-cluster-containing dehydrogenase component
VGNEFMPITQSQPTFEHFWRGIDEIEREISPSKIKVEYIPTLCQHCEDAPCIKEAKENAVYQRPDGIIIIDPVKAAGQKQLIESCPYGVIFWNEAENLPQKCTFCAHLLDDGWEEPRCVQTCPTSCNYFGDLDDPESKISKFLAENEATIYRPDLGLKTHVSYVGLPKPHLSGTVIFGDKDECAGNVKVSLIAPDGTKRDSETDFFGDFEFDGLGLEKYKVQFDAHGYKGAIKEIEITQNDHYLGEVVLDPA